MYDQQEDIWHSYIKPFSHGCAMHYNMLQPGMQIFKHKYGILAFASMRKTCFVLTEPVFSVKEDELKYKFLHDFFQDFPKPVFAYVSEEFGAFLHNYFHFNSTQVGIERLVNLKDWSLNGKRKQVIRTALNKASKEGIYVVENNREKGIYDKLDEWIQTRTHKNKITFLIRSHTGFEPEVRTFCSYNSHNELLGYIQFTPIYKNGRLYSYMPDISGGSIEFKQGLFYVIVMNAMKQFIKEGLSVLNMGLVPLETNKESLFHESIYRKRLVRLMRRMKFYNFDGIDFTKSRFVDPKKKEGIEIGIYLAHKNKLPLLKVIQLFKVMNII